MKAKKMTKTQLRDELHLALAQAVLSYSMMAPHTAKDKPSMPSAGVYINYSTGRHEELLEMLKIFIEKATAYCTREEKK
jgi:uncharacterized protein (UPF0333 family)